MKKVGKIKEGSLYKEVFIALASVGVFAFIGWFLWLPNIQQNLMSRESPVYIVEMCRSVLLYVYMPFVVWCLVLGELTQNLSQVDKVWSLSPPVFCWYITYYEAKQHQWIWNCKLVFMSLLITVWGARLTYQFYKKGGYSIRFWSGEEDYRWVIVRRKMPLLRNRLVFFVFDIGFVCCYQLFLLLSISGVVMVATIMVDRAAGDARNTLNAKDAVIGAMVAILIAIETLSDYQQQVFQREKYRRIQKNLSLECSQNHYEIGFNVNGLFAYSRHPNFTAEQLIWVVFYMFSVRNISDLNALFQLGGPLNATVAGSILLIVLFLKSTNLTEDISSAKYPLYRKYQMNVNRFVDFKLLFRRCFLDGQNGIKDWLK